MFAPMKVTFNEEGHIYKCGDDQYNSVSSVLERFKPPYDREHWSKRKALSLILPNFGELEGWWKDKGGAINQPEMVNFMMEFADPEQVTTIQKKVLAEWAKTNKDSIDVGNQYHLDREDSSYEKGFEICALDGKKYVTYQKERIPGYNESLAENLLDLPDGYYPELLLFSHQYKLAGQSDRVYLGTYRKKRYAIVDDYKSNRKLSTRGMWFKNYGYVMMLPPLDHLENSKLQVYELQLSMYAWMLEQFGFKIKGLCLHHLNKRHDLKYMKKEVELMLNFGK